MIKIYISLTIFLTLGLHAKILANPAKTMQYTFGTDATIKSIEIIAFNEPSEYLPPKKWTLLFNKLSSKSHIYPNKDIQTVTGATLSAKALTDGARVALAFYDEMLQEK